MNSDTDVANAALIAVGEAQITSIDQENTAARLCARLLPRHRDTLLREFDWNFARHLDALAALDETPAHTWLFAYQLPADCLALRGTDVDTSDFTGSAEFAPWEIQGRRVLTNISAPLRIVYTRLVTDVATMDDAFTEAWALRVARDLALPLTQSANLRDTIGRDYMRAVRLARGTSYREVRRATTDNPLAAAMNDW